MLININAAKCVGINAESVTVEVDINKGIGIHLVGLADVAVKESLLRTITALQASEFHVPGRKIVINLAPADMHKRGGGYDLPIALGIIAASGQEIMPDLSSYMIMGELGLDGSVRSVPGALPIVELAKSMKLKACILPLESAREAAEYAGLSLYGVRNLKEVLQILGEREDCAHLLLKTGEAPPKIACGGTVPDNRLVDFAEIIGQDGAKRGMEIAAAGGHNIMMIGAPGSGKSSIAKALAGILPPMSREEAIVVNKIYSVAGSGIRRMGMTQTRPFRSPHYSSSIASMLGGGSGDNIMPGEVSLSQSGVLFIDEYMQMPKSVSEALRAPLEDRYVSISRLKSKVEFPASFMLVAAANPCPCGYYGEGDRCNCSVGARMSYFNRLSGPVLDRIDIQLWLHSVDPTSLIRNERSESSAEIAKRVLKARNVQRERLTDEGICTNAEMNNRQIRRYCPLNEDCERLIERVMLKGNLSARAYTRIIKISRTIADLDGSEDIQLTHLSEAISYRFLDKMM